MEVVNAYVEKRWGIDRSRFVRPFYPGGDYENFDYAADAVVVDNPPFSILGKIKRFYIAHGIPFFLFCPSLTAFSGFNEQLDTIVCDANITYENGAMVRTAFVTSLPSDYVAESAPELGEEINRVCDELRHLNSKTLPKYEYPDDVLTAARLQWMAAHHTELRICRGECCRIAALDSQKAVGKSVFGGGLLLSERAAAERAADRVRVWTLSERERRIQSLLSSDANKRLDGGAACANGPTMT